MLREVMDQLGHTSKKVAIKHYQSTIAAHREEIVNLLAGDFLYDFDDTGADGGRKALMAASEQEIGQLRRLLDSSGKELPIGA